MKKGTFLAFAIFEPKKAPAECLLFTGDNVDDVRTFFNHAGDPGFIKEVEGGIIADAPDDNYPAMFIEKNSVLLKPSGVNEHAADDHAVGSIPRPFFEAHYIDFDKVKKDHGKEKTDQEVMKAVFDGEVDLKIYAPQQP